MRADKPLIPAYNVVIVTLDSHAAGPAARIAPRLAADFPGLTVSVHASAEWAGDPAALAATKSALAEADIVIANLIFIEEHITAILPDLTAARARADAFLG
jgi:magnesium chelatase subunit H